MTLKEIKEKVLKILEEYNSTETNYTEDPDIALKLNVIINKKNFELARYKKIPAIEIMTVIENQELDLYDLDNFFQLNNIKGVDYEKNLNFITFLGNGTAKIYYFKLPKPITSTTDDTYKFEQKNDVLEVMLDGVVADILKNDQAAQYGQIYENSYRGMLQMFDPRDSNGTITIKGGLDI